MKREVDIAAVVGEGYDEFWRFRGRYRVIKGGRAAKKSTTTALWFIYHMMKYRDANGLVLRRFANSHRDSTYAQLQWAIRTLRAEHLWRSSKTPLELVYKPTGQKIMFRGLDDAQSVHSITVERGVLCWVWIEEAFQIASESDFNKIDMSVRGAAQGECFKQLTLTFNPWSSRHWLKKRFFDTESPEILAMTRTYRCNEFLDDHDRAVFDEMERRFPRRYDVEGLGNWGVAEGLVYENWQALEFDAQALLKERPGARALFGLDFGFSSDPTAFIAFVLDEAERTLYIFDELCERNLLNGDIAARLTAMGYAKCRIVADSAEPKSIAELRRLGLTRLRSAKKGPDSVRFGIQRLKSYRLVVHPRCERTLAELSAYVWATDARGQPLGVPADENNHLMDALRYGMEGAESGLAVMK